MSTTRVTIPYHPRAWAKTMHAAPARFMVFICHRRAGKSVAAVNHLLRDALRIPNSRFAYVAPTYKQAKRIIWDYLKFFSRPVPGAEWNESELRVDLPNGSRVMVLGADNPDSLRGIPLWGVVLDEWAQQTPSVFSEIIRPALADHKGYAIFIGTLKGKNHLWHLHETRKEDTEWHCMVLKASESGIIPQEELESARRTMSKEEYEQEFECSPIAFLRGAYYTDQLSDARREGRICRVPYDPTIPVDTVWDLGIGDETAILFTQNIGFETHFIDYYERAGVSLEVHAREVNAKKYVYNMHWLPHDVQARELGTGKTRLEILKSLLGQNVQVTPNIPIDDGINAARMLFPRLWVDQEKCARLLDCIEQYRKEYDEKTGMYKQKPLHDWTSHGADTLRYRAVSSRGMEIARDTNQDIGYSLATGGHSSGGASSDEELIPA